MPHFVYELAEAFWKRRRKWLSDVHKTEDLNTVGYGPEKKSVRECVQPDAKRNRPQWMAIDSDSAENLTASELDRSKIQVYAIY